MNQGKLYYWVFVVALAGFLFGFDTIVISGAEGALQDLWETTDFFHGWVVVSAALWGTVIGAMFGGFPTDRLGRKQTLIWIGVLYSVSAIGSAMVSDPSSFAFFRFLGGLGVGASTIAAPAYISELVPADKRGSMGALYQFSLVLGILIAFISNNYFVGFGEDAWRWMIGIEAFPALIYTGLILTVPRSPRWLITKKDNETEARSVLSQIYNHNDVDQVVADIVSDSSLTKKETLFQNKYSRVIGIAFFVAFFNQFSGINAFLYYAPRIFEKAGLAESTAFLSSIGVGVVNLIFTIVGMFLIDLLGRRTLLYIGSIGYITSLSLVACAFLFEWGGMAVPGFLFLFIASHAIGQGAVIWVLIAEVFPNAVRAQGQALGTSTHWVLAAIIPAMTPWLINSIGAPPVFFFFAFMMVLQLIWVAYYVPETKGKSLEELAEELVKGG